MFAAVVFIPHHIEIYTDTKERMFDIFNSNDTLQKRFTEISFLSVQSTKF